MTEERAEKFLRGCVGVRTAKAGWAWPERFTASQLRILGSVRAWHPGLFRQMAACASGVRLEFATDALELELELACEAVPSGSQSVLADVARWPQAPEEPWDGVSLVVDGAPTQLVALPNGGVETTLRFSLDASEPLEAGATLRLPGLGATHEVEIWLPALRAAAVRKLRHDGSFIQAAPEKPSMLVVGDSIAQGFVSGDPAGAWPSLLARELGLDLLNQGVGGQVFLPGVLADLPRASSPACIVVELGCNYRYERCGANLVRRDVQVFFAELAQVWPEVPTWVLTCPNVLEGVYHTHPRSCVGEVDDILRDEAARYGQIQVVDASKLLSRDEAKLALELADGSDHPNAQGHALMAKRLAKVIA